MVMMMEGCHCVAWVLLVPEGWSEQQLTPHTHPSLSPPLPSDTTCSVITLLPGGNYTLLGFITVEPGRRVSVIGKRFKGIALSVYGDGGVNSGGPLFPSLLSVQSARTTVHTHAC